MSDPPPWYDTAFGAPYLDVYAHRDAAAARREIAWVGDALGPRADLVLDAGCGAGRHARVLAESGRRVVGLDRSGDLLGAARRDGGGPRYVQGDFRALPFRGASFRGLVCLFTAFGYFDDADNARQLAEFRRVLVPGGPLVLDFLNADRVRATLVPRSERDLDGRHLVEERAVRDGRVEKDVTITGPDGTWRWRESVRLYDATEMGALLGRARFRVRRIAGDLEGGPFDATSPRLVLVADAA